MWFIYTYNSDLPSGKSTKFSQGSSSGTHTKFFPSCYLAEIIRNFYLEPSSGNNQTCKLPKKNHKKKIEARLSVITEEILPCSCYREYKKEKKLFFY